MVVEEYANGKLKSRGYIKGKNIRTGEWTFWDENGQKEFAGEYKNGWFEGRCTRWNKDGTIDTELSGIYEDGNKVAPFP